jgi:hypothetical protein
MGFDLILWNDSQHLHTNLHLYVIFVYEVYAIKASIMENLDRNYRNRYIYILSDSQAALKALDKHQINSKFVSDCHQTLMDRGV